MSEQVQPGFNVNDLLGGGKGLQVLADLIKSSFGRVFQSHFVKKDADAKAYELRTLASAKADEKRLLAAAEADSIKTITEAVKLAAPGTAGITVSETGTNIQSLAGLDLALTDRSQSRSFFQEAVRQHNIESVTAIAAEQLKDDTEISDDKVDPDWASRFFRHVEDISNEGMQNIWAKILAGEIKKPNSFSFRTLDMLKSLTSSEAQLFTKYADRITRFNSNQYCIMKIDSMPKIHAIDGTKLREAGLLSSREALSFNLNGETYPEGLEIIENFGTVIEVEYTPGCKYTASIEMITQAGFELVALINPESNVDFMKALAREIRSKGHRVKIGSVTERDERQMPLRFRRFDDWE